MTAPRAGEAPTIQVYDVDGVEVVTATHLEALPERAVNVEFTTTVVDSGDGPELCIGGSDASLPPQCAGPVVVGLDMTGWSEELNGVRWGVRTVVVTWPPVGGVVELIAQSEPVLWESDYPPGEVPAECVAAEIAAGAGPINNYARTIGESSGGLYLANDGTVVLQVVGDPAPHREALAEFGGACVISVSRSATEQLSIQDAIVPRLAEVPQLAGIYAASPGPGGRLEVQVPVADRETTQAIARLVDDPTAIRVVGIGAVRR